MVAFLAALPAIFAAIKGATEVFDLGKKVIEEVKGEAVDVGSSDQLQDEVENLSPDQQASFVERMKEELQVYEAITGRMRLQGGKLDAQTLSEIPEKKRGAIAYMRMTTRPWAVRWMVIAVVFPPLASVCANLFIAGHNVLNDVFVFSPQNLAMINLGEVLNTLYLSMVGWASGVIMTYMGMREVGKAVGHKDGVRVSDITESFSSLFGNVKKVFQ